MKHLSDNAMAIFSEMDSSVEEMNNLMQDVALGRKTFDGEREISKSEAEAKILEFTKKFFGITDESSKKEIRRALDNKNTLREYYNIIEDTIDVAVDFGIQENDWFEFLVDRRNIAYGDRQDFWFEDDAILSVAKGGISHHDHIMQQIRSGEHFSVPTSLYVVKVGADINKYVLGQINWARFVGAVAKAFVNQIQTEVYQQVANASSQLPVTTGFVGTGDLKVATNKSAFDEIIRNVSAANNNSKIVIMGDFYATSKITDAADVNWGAASQKENIANTGNLGVYNGATIVTIPNKFTDKTYSKLQFPTKKLIILAADEEDKFVKLVDEGETIIKEVMERGEDGRVSDLMSYEAQRYFGVGVKVSRQFGEWTVI